MSNQAITRVTPLQGAGPFTFTADMLDSDKCRIWEFAEKKEGRKARAKLIKALKQQGFKVRQ